MHELTTMNVQMRLITADTIDSLTTAGKRSLGNFQTWTKKEMPEEPIEKVKIEKLLNQKLSDDEYQAIVDPAVPEPEMVEFEPKANDTDEPMVLQPLEMESDSDYESESEPLPNMPHLPKYITQPVPQQVQSVLSPIQLQVQQNPLPTVVQAEPVPEPISEPVAESGSEPVTESVTEPVKKDVKKISFSK
jgi:hypothetical protein